MMRKLVRAALLAVALGAGWAVPPAHAVRPDEMLPNPALEARAEAVGAKLRCLVCRNQSIEDSDADLAHDLRMLLRERIAAGDTDQQAIDYIHARYGDYVLLKPPFQMDTLLLWGGPVLFVLAGAFLLRRFYRAQRRSIAGAAPLTEDEQRRLARLIEGGVES